MEVAPQHTQKLYVGGLDSSVWLSFEIWFMYLISEEFWLKYLI